MVDEVKPVTKIIAAPTTHQPTHHHPPTLAWSCFYLPSLSILPPPYPSSPTSVSLDRVIIVISTGFPDDHNQIIIITLPIWEMFLSPPTVPTFWTSPWKLYVLYITDPDEGCCCDDPASVSASDLLPLSAPSVGLRPAEDASQNIKYWKVKVITS